MIVFHFFGWTRKTTQAFPGSFCSLFWAPKWQQRLTSFPQDRLIARLVALVRKKKTEEIPGPGLTGKKTLGHGLVWLNNSRKKPYMDNL